VPILLGVLVSVAVIFAVFAVTLGRGGSMTQFQPDWPGRPLPEDRTVRAADVGTAKFSLAFRGYRMAEVDEALDRIAAEIAERDDAILRLSGRPFESQRTTLAPAATPSEAPADGPLGDDTAPIGFTPIAPEAPAAVSDAPVDDAAAIYMRPPAPAPDDTAPFALPPFDPPAAPSADPLGSPSWPTYSQPTYSQPTYPQPADDRPMYDGPDQ